MAVSVTISIETTVDLLENEVWPDGDTPEHPTAADVVELLRNGGVRQNLRDWCLLDDLDIDVWVDADRVRTHERIKS